MKYVIVFVAGLLAGAMLFLAGLYWNPFAVQSTISPLAVADSNLTELEYSLVPADAVAYVNDGESQVAPQPARVQTLWEPAVQATTVMVVQLHDSRGQPAGVGVKFATPARRSRLFDTSFLTDSYWHIWMTGRGGMTIEQVENRWPWLHDVVLPAHFSSGDNWRGTWFGLVTSGPNAIGTGQVSGGSGQLAGQSGEAVESIRAQAWSVDQGAVAGSGTLTVALPR